MATKFSNLEQTMLKSGFSREITAAALEWLDISKERDMALLEKLTVQDIGRNEIYAFQRAFMNDVAPLGSEELYRRIIFMSYKLLDAMAWKLTEALFQVISDMDNEAFEKLTEDTIREVWGDETQARIFAIRYAKYTHFSSIGYVDLPEEPEPYLEAAELTSDKAYMIKLMLCANALEYMPLPEGKKLSDEAIRAVAIIKHIMKSGIEKDNVYLLTALAPASFFDKELKAHFNKYAAKKASSIYNRISIYLKRPERSFDALFSVGGTFTQDVLTDIMRTDRSTEMPLKSAAKLQTETFKSLMHRQHKVNYIMKMNEALRAVIPDESLGDDELKNIIKEKTANAVASCYKDSDKIKAYINGEIPFDEVWSIVKSTKLSYTTNTKCEYIKSFGEDDFIMRCIAVLGGSVGSYSHHLEEVAGYGRDNITGIADKMLAVGVGIVQALDICGNMLEQYSPYSSDREKYIGSFSSHTDELAAGDITKCNATAKDMALTLFRNDENKYRRQIISLAGDTAKSVRETVAEIIIKHPDWNDDVKSLLKAKKSSARDLALTIIERQGAKAYIPELKNALSNEKTDKLKARIGSMLAVVSGEDSTGETVSAEDIVKDMTKGKKTAKLDWLFKEPFSPVHKKDGTEADVSYLKALMLCFANSVGLKDPNADRIVSELVPEEVCSLANEVLHRWLTTPPEVKSDWVEFFQQEGYECADTLNAQSKYKWVLYFASVYGGEKAMDKFDELMAHWPLLQKGALAKEIPHAIVLNGSSEYIMKVEKMSRKHRFNSIRKASADALLCAAEKLGISKEEFADLMVPDLDFDKNMCRTFDYGTRQFKVYISPKLVPEIYCDGKRLKSMPKPAVSDDEDKADAAYKEFTAMKKLMKTVVAAQLVRLENTMRTARSWTFGNWQKLFVANPIMHRFAIGLIWGIYKEDKLEKSFRYLDDGSFTTVDDEELTIPEDSQIGLVHPVELSDDELSAWLGQLKDYDIIQPFVQLERSVFKPTEEERSKDSIDRFKGQIMKSVELASAMNRIGWSKGQAGDGAMIDDFIREDIFARNNGIKVSLRHSGMSVEIYRGEEIDVTIGELCFYKLPGGERMNVNDLRDRYFSEIMHQLVKVFVL